MERRKASQNSSSTLVQRTLDSLTNEIMSGRLRPNQRISEISTAKKLGISRSPIREALRILERDGLVTYEPGRGVFVTDITPEDADELYLIHGHLLGLAMRLACQKMTPNDVSKIAGLVKSLRSTVNGQDRQRFVELRARLEQTIAEKALSPRLARLLSVMGQPCARYRALHVNVPGYMDEVVKCYEGISQAFHERDADQAEELRLQIVSLGRELLKLYFMTPADGNKMTRAKTQSTPSSEKIAEIF